MMFMSKVGGSYGLQPLQGQWKIRHLNRSCYLNTQRREELRLPASVPKSPFIHKKSVQEVTQNAKDSRLQSAKILAATAEDNEEKGSMGTLAHGYLIFSIAYAAMGLMQLCAPQKLMEISSGISLLPAAECMVRAAGVWSLLLAVFMKSLVDAVKNNRLSSETYKRFAWWAALSHTIIFFVFLKPTAILPTGVLLLKALVPTALLVLYWKAYEEIPILAIIPDFISGATNTFKPANWKATAFSIYIIKFAVMGLMLSIVPAISWNLLFGLSIDQFGTQITRQTGLYAGALVVAGYTLKDGADRGRLGASTFKNIALILGFVSLGNALLISVLYPKLFVPILRMPFIIFEGAYAALCIFLYFTEKK